MLAAVQRVAVGEAVPRLGERRELLAQQRVFARRAAEVLRECGAVLAARGGVVRGRVPRRRRRALANGEHTKAEDGQAREHQERHAKGGAGAEAAAAAAARGVGRRRARRRRRHDVHRAQLRPRRRRQRRPDRRRRRDRRDELHFDTFHLPQVVRVRKDLLRDPVRELVHRLERALVAGAAAAEDEIRVLVLGLRERRALVQVEYPAQRAPRWGTTSGRTPYGMGAYSSGTKQTANRGEGLAAHVLIKQTDAFSCTMK